MGTITLELPPELERDIKEFKLNWSEIAINAIIDKSEKLKRLKSISTKIKISEKSADVLADNLNKAVAERFFKEVR